MSIFQIDTLIKIALRIFSLPWSEKKTGAGHETNFDIDEGSKLFWSLEVIRWLPMTSLSERSTWRKKLNYLFDFETIYVNRMVFGL